MKCSHIAAQIAPGTGRELALCGFEGKSSWHFHICCFLKTKLLALIVSQCCSLLCCTANKHPAGMYLKPWGEDEQRHLSGRGQCPQSWLRGQKWWKRTAWLSSETVWFSVGGLAVALQTENCYSCWLNWEQKGFCRELESDFLYVPYMCSCNCRKHLHALHHFFFCVRKLLSCFHLGMGVVNCRVDTVLWRQTPSCFHFCLVTHLYLLQYKSIFFAPHSSKRLDFYLFHFEAPEEGSLDVVVCFCTWVLPCSETLFKKGWVYSEVFLLINK